MQSWFDGEQRYGVTRIQTCPLINLDVSRGLHITTRTFWWESVRLFSTHTGPPNTWDEPFCKHALSPRGSGQFWHILKLCPGQKQPKTDNILLMLNTRCWSQPSDLFVHYLNHLTQPPACHKLRRISLIDGYSIVLVSLDHNRTDHPLM